MKKLLTLTYLMFSTALLADIKPIDSLDQILPVADEKTIVFLDVDETLVELSIMLGRKAWRQYARNQLKKEKSEAEVDALCDQITYLFAKQISYLPIEEKTVECVTQLQEQNIPVFALTSRGKHHWYDMPVDDGERLTILHLQQAGIDLNQSHPLTKDPLFTHQSYGQGVFFTYPLEDKGELIEELFALTDYRPSQIIFVDDKIDYARSVDRALQKLGIPSLCFHYRYIERHDPFDPMIAHIQLEHLLLSGKILSNAEAAGLKDQYRDKDPDDFFLELVNLFS